MPSHKSERTERKYSQELRFGWRCYFNGLLSMSTSTRYKNWHPPVLMLMSVMVNMAKPVEDPQIKIRVLTIYTIHLGGNFRCKYSVLQLVETQIGKIRRCTSINWKGQKEKKSASIKPIAYNFWNVSNGMVCTISFSNQNFRVFRVNGKRPLLPNANYPEFH